jgi:hypothetical protein
MTSRCLICNSSVVLTKDAAKAIALLMGAINGFLKGVRRSDAHPPSTSANSNVENPLEQAFHLMIDGISGAASSWAGTEDFIRDVRTYQFMNYDYQCLRCGAIFNEETKD